MRKLFWLVVPLVGLLVIGGCAREKETVTEFPPPAVYAGSVTCQGCHPQVYTEYMDSGHPYKLTMVEGGVAPTFPHSSVPNPPDGYTWNDISYVIGGYGWKARFIDNQGYIITGGAVQYNLETQEWVAYHEQDPPGTKSYDCGRCHTTGYVPSETEHQDGLPGIVGTWAEPGITCERCHGPGSQHAMAPENFEMRVDRTSDLCGECHYRSADHRILASGGLIRHHEQYDEMVSDGHSAHLCVDCHDPHKSAVYDAANAIISNCSDCHSQTVNHLGPDDCVNCHMPYSVKSAVKENDGTIHLKGDIRSHIFRINSDTTQAQFYDDGGSTYSRGFNGLNFACLAGCHSARDLEWAATYADSIHVN